MNWFKIATKKNYFEVHLRWKGNRYIEEIQTENYSAAVTAAKTRFPKAYIAKVVRKKK